MRIARSFTQKIGGLLQPRRVRAAGQDVLPVQYHSMTRD